MAELKTKIKKFDHCTTISVAVEKTKEFRVRIALAVFLIRMAAKIMGCGFKKEIIEPEKEWEELFKNQQKEET